jgi:hypothetical protein
VYNYHRSYSRAAIVVGFSIGERSQQFCRDVIKTEAKVTRSNYFSGGSRSRRERSIKAIFETSFEFTSKDNRKISAKARTPEKHVGDTITVYYIIVKNSKTIFFIQPPING